MIFSKIINGGRSCWDNMVKGDRFILRNHLLFYIRSKMSTENNGFVY